MLSKQEIINTICPILLRSNVSKASLFGSIVAGDFSESSDLDLLVEYGEETSLLDHISLKLSLEKVLGCKVDLITYRSLNKLIRPHVEQTEELIIG